MNRDVTSPQPFQADKNDEFRRPNSCFVNQIQSFSSLKPEFHASDRPCSHVYLLSFFTFIIISLFQSVFESKYETDYVGLQLSCFLSFGSSCLFLNDKRYYPLLDL